MKKTIALLFLSSLAFGDVQQCYTEASNQYGVPLKLLYAITKVESDFHPFCINMNGHGKSIWSKCYKDYNTAYYVARRLYYGGYNIDLGLMQINSQNMKDHGWRVSYVLDPCFNVFYGAYLLRENINRYGFNWRAIWHYNGSPSYAYKVANALRSLNYNFANYTFNYTPAQLYSYTPAQLSSYTPMQVFSYSNNKVNSVSNTINNGYFTTISGG